MIRRQFVAATAVTGTLVLSGCSSSGTSSPPDEGSLWIANEAGSDQTVEITVTDAGGETVYEAQYELTPDDADEKTVSEDGSIAVGDTYDVTVTTDDHRETFEWDVARNRSVLNVYVEDTGVRFERDAPEG
ncbi:hypothetical protein [Natrononativus amylolyticus]|uniref:hypothetical protein n=1 Tax=Natrononativus amylolyticus TaxID=2963434 RepID=UPI0020CEF2E0|nr:hypothetical protein [Natrononativus amylolyticus]